ncbi:hypothetical protein LTR17_026259 [Elasticomyces elasticus]|nr:hypothetical protein LTR17_026259 [Elasticomyces elasticus]
MRTSTAAWAAALAVMSMTGPYTKAEAAPARRQQDQERPRYYAPKAVKRQGYTNSTISPIETSSSSSSVVDIPTSNVYGPPPSSAPSATTSTQSEHFFTPLDPLSVLESLMDGGYLSETANTVVTTTWTQTTSDQPYVDTATYTITYTETTSPSSTSSPALISSSSSAAPISPSSSSVHTFSSQAPSASSYFAPTAYSSSYSTRSFSDDLPDVLDRGQQYGGEFLKCAVASSTVNNIECGANKQQCGADFVQRSLIIRLVLDRGQQYGGEFFKCAVASPTVNNIECGANKQQCGAEFVWRSLIIHLVPDLQRCTYHQQLTSIFEPTCLEHTNVFEPIGIESDLLLPTIDIELGNQQQQRT